jgi:restriction system protein
MADFLTEMMRAANKVAKAQAQAARQAERERVAAERKAEQARKQLERAREADRKRLEKEAKEAHVAARMAEVDELNRELENKCEEIDGLLNATLEVDDYVDLEALRVKVDHPPFDRVDLEAPASPREVPPDPPEPVFIEPPPPARIDRLLGGKRQLKAEEKARARHEEALKEWREKIAQLESARKSAIQEHKRAEARRLKELEVAKERYAKECAAREAEAASMNAEIDKFIADLGYGTVEAVQKYVEIVLANSTYPDHFPITHDFSFAPATAELKLKVLVPPPEELSSIKAYKYTKTSDEISSTTLSQKAQKDRYQGAVHQVALRSIHEVFEADRRELIQTISLEVGTETLHPATGLEAFIPFVAVACERAAFQEFDLSAIVPLATLEHLGAALSKNPFGLVAADTKGVRRT